MEKSHPGKLFLYMSERHRGDIGIKVKKKTTKKTLSLLLKTHQRNKNAKKYKEKDDLS